MTDHTPIGAYRHSSIEGRGMSDDSVTITISREDAEVILRRPLNSNDKELVAFDALDDACRAALEAEG